MVLADGASATGVTSSPFRVGFAGAMSEALGWRVPGQHENRVAAGEPPFGALTELRYTFGRQRRRAVMRFPEEVLLL